MIEHHKEILSSFFRHLPSTCCVLSAVGGAAHTQYHFAFISLNVIGKYLLNMEVLKYLRYVMASWKGWVSRMSSGGPRAEELLELCAVRCGLLSFA